MLAALLILTALFWAIGNLLLECKIATVERKPTSKEGLLLSSQRRFSSRHHNVIVKVVHVVSGFEPPDSEIG